MIPVAGKTFLEPFVAHLTILVRADSRCHDVLYRVISSERCLQMLVALADPCLFSRVACVTQSWCLSGVSTDRRPGLWHQWIPLYSKHASKIKKCRYFPIYLVLFWSMSTVPQSTEAGFHHASLYLRNRRCVPALGQARLK